MIEVFKHEISVISLSACSCYWKSPAPPDIPHSTMTSGLWSHPSGCSNHKTKRLQNRLCYYGPAMSMKREMTTLPSQCTIDVEQMTRVHDILHVSTPYEGVTYTTTTSLTRRVGHGRAATCSVMVVSLTCVREL